jgi:hypothetical protein
VPCGSGAHTENQNSPEQTPAGHRAVVRAASLPSRPQAPAGRRRRRGR